MKDSGQLLELVGASKSFGELCKVHRKGCITVGLNSLVEGAYVLYVASAIQKWGGVHILVAEDRDGASYLANDLYTLLDEQRVLFMPSSYKRSVAKRDQEPSAVVQRTAALSAVHEFSGDGYLVVCTYPEAMAECVADAKAMQSQTIGVKVGDKLSIEFVENMLLEAGFERVDFVYEPGQYSQRGGIVDVFSYSQPKPFRLDFFGDEVDSIREFEISSQLSTGKFDHVDIVPNLTLGGESRTSFARFVGEVTYWFDEAQYVLRKIDDIRKKALSELEEPSQIDAYTTSRKQFVEDTAQCRWLVCKGAKEREVELAVEFATRPQPKFNKQFEILADDIVQGAETGRRTYILSENKAQIERLKNIFHKVNRGDVTFTPLSITLHSGFVSEELKASIYTDHQIFDRYHRYKLRGEIARDESMTIAELNHLKVGDYVVHIDHGVGKFGGLVKMTENGKTHEAIKLVYRDNDVLFVNVHAMHRISRYKDGEATPPKIYKLGSAIWQRMKDSAKKAVKDIARELIALYAKRKASEGFSFSADTYLQQELEASFVWEDTPDQQKATEAVKRDMESPQPMDRLVCGDVGFGKTEVAVRAAFKAAIDGKQVAILVPTTILALQHYRTFTQRLRDFPVRIEHLSRTRTSKDTTAVLSDLAEGKVDILIGTHKILGKSIKFKDLGLLIIDEEQKFGVTAKEKLRQMSISVDTLTLTATPIPRTLQFSLMGSRDLSVISTPPPNRQPIVTECCVRDEAVIKEAIDAELERGGQVYFVHNKIDDLLTIQGMVSRLCPDARTAIGHGQMKADNLEKLIMDFIYGEFDVLISTTIVESGIDIPNVNTIIINNAQNYGLSELHQLRGRVGRSDRRAYCYLLTPDESLLTTDARRRLRALEEFSDLGSGFNIAMQDLDIRGAGNLLGAQQSGFIADIGLETYQKIMREAMAELRTEGLNLDGLPDGGLASAEQLQYIDDAVIDTDVVAQLPDAYIGQVAEKLRLYRHLDTIGDEEALQRFEAELKDRFGELPQPALDLLDIVRLRREAITLGMERVKVKNGLMIVQFVGNQDSAYYKSELFIRILRRITAQPAKFVMRQNNNRLSMTVRSVSGLKEAVVVLQELGQE